MSVQKSILTKILMITASAVGLVACEDDNDSNTNVISEPTSIISFIPTNLEPLGDDFDYEGWLITPNGAVATGKFDIDPNDIMATQTFAVNTMDADEATTFVLTIEPSDEMGDDILAPSDVHILGGDITNNTSILTTSHGAALGTDFNDAVGKYILATPTNGNMTPTQGIWYIDNSSGMAIPGLTLPTLTEGWQYEGWIVDNGMPLSTGTFLQVDEADSDGAGPYKGDLGAPAFPGQDYINPFKDLVGKTAVISVEPFPDNSVEPFSIKPLAGMILDNQGVMMLDNIVMDNLPSATISIR